MHSLRSCSSCQLEPVQVPRHRTQTCVQYRLRLLLCCCCCCSRFQDVSVSASIYEYPLMSWKAGEEGACNACTQKYIRPACLTCA